MHTRKLLGIAATALLLLGAGCGKTIVQEEVDESLADGQVNDQEQVAPTSTPAEVSATSTVHVDIKKDTEVPPVKPVVPAPAAVREFKITAKQWEFVPGTIRVKKGEKVRLVVTSADAVHGIMLSEYNINKSVKPGETVTIEFTADKAGTFAMICSVQCGAGHADMRGQLIVE